jgi:hypothetical protein
VSAGPGQPGGWGVPRDSASEGVESEVEEEGEELDGAPWSSWDAVGEDESVEEESEPASSRDHKTLGRLMVLLRVTEAETAEVEEAMFRDHDLNYGLEQAQKWGIEFLEGARSRGEPSPMELAQHDEVELKAAGGLEQLASNRFRERESFEEALTGQGSSSMHAFVRVMVLKNTGEAGSSEQRRVR